MLIYKITNAVNNKVYIGQTTNTLKYRFDQHLRETASLKRKNTYFHNAIEKYGIENFVVEKIDEAETIEELNQKEIFWIEFYKSNQKQFGYNLDSGGENCFKSTETKLKIGEEKKKHWENEDLRIRMLQGLQRGTEVWKEICADKEIIIYCANCNSPISLPKNEAERRKYCSHKCADEANYANRKKNSDKGAFASKQKWEGIWEDNKSKVLNWALQNQEFIFSCPSNRISTYLYPMLEETGIQDMRMVAKAVIGNYNKKALLLFLQNYLKSCDENIC